MALPAPTITFSIDGNLLHTTYGVYVRETRGILDLPKMKDPVKYNWPDLPGESIDLTNPLFEPKEFYLDCFISATSVLDFTQKLNTFLKAIINPIATGTHRLHVQIDAVTAVVYQVYLPDGAAANIRFRRSAGIGTFTLKFREPEPVKKIYKWSAPPYAVTFTTVSSKPINIYWGDNTITPDLAIDQAVTSNHTYSSTGVKWIILTGDLESISYLTTTATLVWDKLL